MSCIKIWTEVRQKYPDQWLLIEALEAKSEGEKRILNQITVINPHEGSGTAISDYQHWHRKFPQREFYVIHTERKDPNITERRWSGIRRF